MSDFKVRRENGTDLVIEGDGGNFIVNGVTFTAEQVAIALAAGDLDATIIGSMASLNTTAKNTLVAAINEVLANANGAITDVLTGYTSTTGAITAADSILSAIEKLNGNSAVKYTKPGGGIPSSDMETAVQSSLTKADGSTAGIASGYKIARGVSAVTGTLDLTTGLATVVSIVVSLAEDASPTGDTVTATIPTQTGGTAGHATLKVWQPTAANNSAPTASSTPKNVAWIAIGT